MKMKYALALFFVLGSPQGLAFSSQFTCERIIFSGLTFKKDKKVQVCLDDKGVIYTFGSVAQVPPEVDIHVPVSAVSWFHSTQLVRDSQLPPGKTIKVFSEGLSITDKEMRYQLSLGRNGETHHETIKVYTGEKRTSKIRLNSATCYSKIDEYLWDDFDIPRAEHGIW